MTTPATPSNAGSPNVGEGVETTVRQTSPVVADYGANFLVAHVSADGKLVGIDHPCDAEWSTVMAAHVALRDRINERIAAQDGCPFKPSTRATSPTVPAIPVDREADKLEQLRQGAFITSTSGGGRYVVTLKYQTMDEMHRAHDLLVRRPAASPAYTPRPVEGEVERLREALKPLAFEGVTIPRDLDRDAYWFTDALTGRSITVGQVLDARAALARPVEAGAGKLGEVERIVRWIDQVIERAKKHGNTEGLWLFRSQWQTVRAALTTPAGGIAEGDSAVIATAQFLSDRLDDLEWMDGALEDTLRDYMGHVDPAHARLKSALADREKGA